MLSESQIEARKGFIGASESADICGLGFDGESGPYNLWAKKTGKVPPWIGNEETFLGDALEDAVVNLGLDALDKTYGLLSSVRAPETIVSGRMGANLDCWVNLATPESSILEAKTSGLTGPLRYEDWGDPFTSHVPEKYIIQCNHQMHLAGQHVQRAFLAALLGSRGFVLYVIPRDQEAIDAIIEACESFWANHVETDIPPDSLPSMDVAKRLRRTKGKQVAFDASLLLTWQRAKDEKKAADKTEEAAKLAVIAALGDADAGVSEAGGVTFYEQSRAGYEVKPCSFRVLRAKGK